MRYGIFALIIGVVAIIAILPVTTAFVEQWARRDVQERSELIASAVRDQVALLAAAGDGSGLTQMFDRLAADEKLLAIGFCGADDELHYASRLMPAAFSCEKVARAETDSFSTMDLEGRHLGAASFPISAQGVSGHLVVLHDLSFVERRSTQARNIMVVTLGGVALGGAALATLVALVIMRGWLRSVRRALDAVQTGKPDLIEVSDETPLGLEVRNVLREMNEQRQSMDADTLAWTPDTLRMVLKRELPDAEVIVVSNREPYIHNRTDDGAIMLQVPASGLVSAMEPVVRACSGTWIAHGSGSADRDTVDRHDRLRVPPSAPTYTLRRVWLTEEEQEGYYYGFANEGLWPLCHIAFVRPVFREGDWECYRAVNRRFADAIVAEAKTRNPIVLVQDYHFALLPKMVRERLPEATIITFWHIPWPNAESFGICPWKEEIVEGLLGSSILGFHTQFHCNNFVDTVDRFVESRIDREHASITLGGDTTFIRPFPISIEWPPAALIGQAPIEECRRAVRERLGLPANVRLGVGIERFDYTKGILDRMQAVDTFLTAHPEWRGRFVFVQAAAPTRSKLPAYHRLQDDALALAAEINDRHRAGGIEPIRLVIRHHEPSEVFELFRAADLCIVSSLHDGMNLVAKEFVAARDDGIGVLVLSSFAGASRELAEALIVNPYDSHDMARAIHRALDMPESEQRDRMRLMRDVVRGHNVYRWAGNMLLDAARLRRRRRILTTVSNERRRVARGG